MMTDIPKLPDGYLIEAKDGVFRIYKLMPKKTLLFQGRSRGELIACIENLIEREKIREAEAADPRRRVDRATASRLPMVRGRSLRRIFS